MQDDDRKTPTDWGELRRRLADARAGLAQSRTPSDEEQRLILKARARELAREPVAQAEPGAQLEVIEFRLSNERYAVESALVREVCPLKDLTPVPCTPLFVLGVVSLRGQILSVVDLRRFFDLLVQGLGDSNKAVVVRSRGMELGVLTGELIGVRRLSPDDLQPAPSTLTGAGAEYIKGVTADRLVLLDLEKLLRDPALIVREEVNV